MNPTQQFILAIFSMVLGIAIIYTGGLWYVNRKNQLPQSPIKPKHKKDFGV